MKTSGVIKLLKKIPKSGIYCLIHKKRKNVYIYHSIDICTSIVRHLKNIQDKTHIYKQIIKDQKSLEFVFLENIYKQNKSDIDVKLYHWMKHYKELGYNVYNYINLCRYRTRIDIDDIRLYLYVKLISRRYDEVIVGKFDNIIEAREFAKLYENMEFITPIYAINNLSREYFKGLR